VRENSWLQSATPAFRLMIATSWLAPASWQEHQEKAIREAIGAGVDWMEYLCLVDRHRTPALSWAALKRVPGLEIPEPTRRELQKRSDACRMQAVRHSMMLAEVLRGFNRAGIPVMTLKGPLLSLELYGDIGLRQSKDLDLEVTLEDLPKAQACLENMGWRLESAWSSLTPRQWGACLKHEHHIGFVHSNGGLFLELHWRSQWEKTGETAGKWARGIPSEWQGCSYRAMNPVDLSRYLCSHGGIHAWFRAKWLGDLARIYGVGRVDWIAVLDEARRTGQDRAVLASLYLLNLVYGLPLPGLRGSPWEDLPSLLIELPLHDLRVPEEPGMSASLASLRNRLRGSRYEKLLLPHKIWRDLLVDLTYCHEDFRVIRLPDSLYWTYGLLRPILWFWRRVLRGRQANR
jgi:hypothetical protein